ncbi:MAG: hypothetical protein KKE02_16580 [Alphaproteobacteria bacterium]|nr:hypothetical protein [Alphaproteobacteria bacterium]MBU2152640.1 hypothetical protein [Alphaproteobacteria bacterium]MBU2362774.1 hypothetical protein [Alphaproteobacteria bacterium]
MLKLGAPQGVSQGDDGHRPGAHRRSLETLDRSKFPAGPAREVFKG